MAASAGEAVGATTPEATSPFSEDWREWIIIPVAAAGEPPPVPTLFYVFLELVLAWAGVPDPAGLVGLVGCAGVVGAAFGLLSRHRARLGAARAAVTYAANLAIVAGCYGGARELARDARATTPDDPMNSVVGGLASGAVLGLIQGGHFGAVKYAVTFAAAGTALDYAALKLAPEWHAWKEQFSGRKDWFTLPEWSPIQVLDEEALAKKKAREEKLFAQRALGKLDKEDP